MHPWWITLPGILIGGILFLGIGGYGLLVLMENAGIGDDAEEGKKKKPAWVGCLCMLIAYLGIYPWCNAFGEKRVIAAFAEGFVANVLYQGVPLGAAVAGYFSGKKVDDKTGQRWLAWVIGIVVFTAIALPARMISEEIPGVGWRIEKMSEEHEDADDYDPY